MPDDSVEIAPNLTALPPTPDEPTAVAVEREPVSVVEVDVLVEDVSIDGMCGVY